MYSKDPDRIRILIYQRMVYFSKRTVLPDTLKLREVS